MSSDKAEARKAGRAESRKPFFESEELDFVLKVRFYWASKLLGVLFGGDSSSQGSDSVNLDRMPGVWFFINTQTVLMLVINYMLRNILEKIRSL